MLCDVIALDAASAPAHFSRHHSGSNEPCFFHSLKYTIIYYVHCKVKYYLLGLKVLRHTTKTTQTIDRYICLNHPLLMTDYVFKYRKRLIKAYNPFWSDDEEPSSDEESGNRR